MERPADRPFDAALIVGEILRARKEVRGRARAVADLFLEVIGEAAGKLEHRLGRDVFDDQLGRAFPANFDAREQLGLRAREPIEPRGLELEGRWEEDTSELQ